MDNLIRIRTKWDESFDEKAINIFVKIFGMAAFAVSTFALAKLFPFIHVFEDDPKILFAVLMAALFFVNETMATLLFAFVLFLAMSGGQAMVAILAGIMCTFACGNSKIVVALTALVPLFVMNIVKMDSELMSINLPFIIFFLCVYFNGKIANRTWQYAFPIYFTLVAYNFGLYGTVVKKFLATTWKKKDYQSDDYNPIDLFVEKAGFDRDFQNFDLTAIIILVLISLVVCYLIYMLISNKNINYLNLQVDVREAIVFFVGIILVCISMIVIRGIHNPKLEIPFVPIIVQGVLAYVLTRPFASHQVCSVLQKSQTNYEASVSEAVRSSREFAQPIKDEIQKVVSTYLMQNAFDDILLADKYPINGILVFGKTELDKHLILEKVFDGSNVAVQFCKSEDMLNEYIKNDNLAIFDTAKDNKKLQIIVFEKIENLFANETLSEAEKKHFLKYFIERVDSFKTNKYVLFIMTTDSPTALPEELYQEGCIDKIVYGMQRDSVLLGDTYRLICPVGKGGGGLVYKAYHERLETMVAVKKIIHTFSNKHANKTEAVALKSIKHMYLPKVYDVFEEKGAFYTVMDFVPGHTLQDEMKKKGALSQKSVLEWGMQLTDAVNYLHNQNPPIIHSDIKPSNVMLTPEGSICLIDFNISLIFDKDNSSVAVTPGYSPIEQYGNIEAYYKTLGGTPKPVVVKHKDEYATMPLELMEDATMPIEHVEIIQPKAKSQVVETRFAECGLSEKSDVYSLGATLYALLAGKRPDTNFELVEPLYIGNPNISKDFSDVIEKAMCINPEERYENVDAFQKALKRVVIE